jgi:hypothetical protein
MKKGYIVLFIWLIIIFGWFRNIYKLTQCDFDVPLKTEVIRSIGIVIFPIGAIIGYMDIGKE